MNSRVKLIYFFLLICKVIAGSSYLLLSFVDSIAYLFFSLEKKHTAVIQSKLLLFWRNQGVGFGNVDILCKIKIL